MSYTVGLDFGTHQTKICIQDSSNHLQKTFQFFEFSNEVGELTPFFPSVIQITKENTLRYGFVEESNSKVQLNQGAIKPELIEVEIPIFNPTPEPIKKKYPSKPKELPKILGFWKDQLRQLQKQNTVKTSPLDAWKEACRKIDNDYATQLKAWEKAIQKEKAIYQRNIAEIEQENSTRRANYALQLQEWEDKKEELLFYKYFKLATFSDSEEIRWEHNIQPKCLTVWFITYMLFLIQEKIGQDFFLYFGIPSGVDKAAYRKQKDKAIALLIASYKLVELYKSKELFLNENYQDLLELTKIDYSYTQNEINYYGLGIKPEAFAGLLSLTSREMINFGMSLLVDIGGGTTDIAFFTITDGKQPNIHSVLSFPKGLNFIYESFADRKKNRAIEYKSQSITKKETELYTEAIDNYHIHLKFEVNRMIENIVHSFDNKKEAHGLHISRLKEALLNRPIIYGGGGSLNKQMRIPINYFKDIKLLSKEMLGIPILKNKKILDEHFTILSTAYGLSIDLEDEIKLTSIENVFNHITKYKEDSSTLKDYVHGLTQT